jgi:hypothetical protein
LRVQRGGFNHFAEDAAGGIDLLDRQLDAVLEVGAGGGTRAGQLDDVGDFDGLGLRQRGAGQCGDGGQRNE